MKRILIAVLIVGMVALSGCAMVEDDGDSGETGPESTAEFSESVTFPWAAIAGEEVTVQVSVENTGNASGTYEAAIQADDEELTSDSVEVEAGESTTLTLTHVFEEPGEYDLTVAGEERQITVYDTFVEYINSEDTNRGGIVTEDEQEIDAEMIYKGQQLDYHSESTATTRTNYTAETQYTEAESTISVADETWDETTQEWIVDGTLYEKTVDHRGETTYVKEQSDEFEDDSTLPTDTQEEYVRTEHTDDEYVVIVDATNPDDASTLAALISDDMPEVLPPESLESLYLEFHLDRQLVRPNSMTMEVSATEFQMDETGGFKSFDMTMSSETVEYNATVEVEVPDDVRENAEYE